MTVDVAVKIPFGVMALTEANSDAFSHMIIATPYVTGDTTKLPFWLTKVSSVNVVEAFIDFLKYFAVCAMATAKKETPGEISPDCIPAATLHHVDLSHRKFPHRD